MQNRINNNLGNGVLIRSSLRNAVTGNEIMNNQAYGLLAYGWCLGTVVRDNTIASNARGDVDLTNSRGIVYVP